jgi:N-acetylmuramoyl-L-alanine amidase
MPTRSPNYNDRPLGAEIKFVIIHYTGMETAEEALSTLCDPEAEVSSHYFISEDGECLQLVDDQYRAWHAGFSYWQGLNHLNHYSIGIELVNPGDRPFADAQIDSLIELCLQLKSKYNIAPACFLGHSDIAPERKQDPGVFFPWEKLAQHGLGIYPAPDSEPVKLTDIFSLQQLLQEFGYKIEPSGQLDNQTCAVIEAFKRHFAPSPEPIDSSWSNELSGRLINLLGQLEESNAA